MHRFLRQSFCHYLHILRFPYTCLFGLPWPEILISAYFCPQLHYSGKRSITSWFVMLENGLFEGHAVCFMFGCSGLLHETSKMNLSPSPPSLPSLLPSLLPFLLPPPSCLAWCSSLQCSVGIWQRAIWWGITHTHARTHTHTHTHTHTRAQRCRQRVASYGQGHTNPITD